MPHILIVVGGSSTALEIREMVETYYLNIYDTVYNIIGDNEQTSLSNIVRDSELDAFFSDVSKFSFIIGFSNVELKQKFRTLLVSKGGYEVNVIHPNAYIAPSAKLGKGIYLACFSVISSHVCVDDGALINFNVTVGHDSHVGRDCCINPGARISGHVSVGNRVLIGSNSCVFQGMSIGTNTTVDAMTYVDRNIGESQICTNKLGTLKIFDKRLR